MLFPELTLPTPKLFPSVPLCFLAVAVLCVLRVLRGENFAVAVSNWRAKKSVQAPG